MMLTVLMGVSGSGKSTIGRRVAERSGIAFLEGDDFHPPENIALMAAGTPLDDAQRRPWIAAIGDTVRAQDGDAVLACSALSPFVRDYLKNQCACEMLFIHLDGSRELIAERLVGRKGHFFSAALLDSQFDALDLDDAIRRVPIDKPVDTIAAEVAAIIASHKRPDQRRHGKTAETHDSG